MKNKIKKIFSMVLIGIMVGAIPAIADTLTWSGQGAETVTTCISGETPYLFWVFTTGAGNPSGSEKLIVNGDEYSGDIPGKSSIVQFQVFHTPFYTMSGLTAHVDYNANILGGGNPNLVISHGCTGGTNNIPEFPTIALPIVAVIGLLFFFQHKKRKEE